MREYNMSISLDPDEVYKEAVKKLRILLSASEVANMKEEFDLSLTDDVRPFDLIGSVEHLNRGGITDPPYKERYKSQYVKRNSKVRRNLFDTKPTRERHNSWHNLVQIDPSPSPELHLVQKQEKYIDQLEKETKFCRDQLSFVLQNVKQVLNEKEAAQRSQDVSAALANVFGTIQGWEAKPGAGVKTNDSEFVQKLQNDCQTLTETVRAMKQDLDLVKRREEEAVEQVKRSVQAAEQLRMEKTEVEYELAQVKLQVDRQQQRIRTLIEEQVTKVDEERELIEKRTHDQVKSIREEVTKNLEEVTKLTSEIDQYQMMHKALKAKIEDRDKIIDNLKEEMEKQAQQFQIESVQANSTRKALEMENTNLRIDLDHLQHELKAETARKDVIFQSLNQRLAKSEEMLMKSRQESLELTEEKAALEKATKQKEQHEKLANSVQNRKKDSLGNQIHSAKLEEVAKRQSRIIAELRQSCSEVTDKLEETSFRYEEEKRSLTRRLESLTTERMKLLRRCSDLEAELEDRDQNLGRLQGRVDLYDKNEKSNNWKQLLMNVDSWKREKIELEHEIEFYKEILERRGFLPERESLKAKSKDPKGMRPKSAPKASPKSVQKKYSPEVYS